MQIGSLNVRSEDLFQGLTDVKNMKGAHIVPF